MATDSLWIRLNIDWDRAKWIRHLPRATRSLWPDLLRWVKMNSPVKGYIAYEEVEALAWDLRLDDDEVEALQTLLSAALLGGAISITNGRLFIENWDEYQDPETIRKRRAKEKAQGASVDSGNSGQLLTDEKGAENSAPSAKTETETETDLENKDAPAGGFAPKSLVAPMTVDVHQEMLNLGVDKSIAAEQAEIYVNRRKATGWKIGSTPIVDWRADVKSWISNPHFASSTGRASGYSPPPKEDPLTASELDVLESNQALSDTVRQVLTRWRDEGLKSAKCTERTVLGYVRQLAARGVTPEVLGKYESRVLAGATFAPSVYELIRLLEPHIATRAVIIAEEPEVDEETRAQNLERFGTENPTLEQIKQFMAGRLGITDEDRARAGAA